MNPHAVRHENLNLAWLPITSIPHIAFCLCLVGLLALILFTIFYRKSYGLLVYTTNITELFPIIVYDTITTLLTRNWYIH